MLTRALTVGAGTAAGMMASGMGVAKAQVPTTPGIADDLIAKGPHPWVDVRAYGATGDGSVDDGPAIRAALAAANTGKGGLTQVYLPAGVYRIASTLALPSNVTLFGDGSRPGNQGGTEILYSGSGTAVTAGAPGQDWSNSQIRGLRVARDSSGGSDGWGLQVFNPTNVSMITDVLVTGFREGGIHVANGSGGDGNPGANFFKLSNFFIIGGRKPLYLQRGRQTVLIQFGGIDVDDTSQCGALIETGEAQAHVTTVESVKVESRGRNVPGFQVTGIAPVTFVGCTYYNMTKAGTAPAFLYTNQTQPDLQTQLVGCTSMGTSTFFSAPERNVHVRADASRGYYAPQITVAGGGMVVPMTTRNNADRTWAMHKDVRMGWTDDTGDRAAIDTTLYRSRAKTLQTDGTLVALDGVSTKVVKGAVTDKSFSTPPPDGTMALDSTNDTLYVRSKGKWRKVTLG